jgi:hypothetical protein
MNETTGNGNGGHECDRGEQALPRNVPAAPARWRAVISSDRRDFR